MSDQYELEISDCPEELTEILEPEVAPEREEKEQPEAVLPIPADLDLVQRYIREANRFALLTPVEEKSLSTRFRETGDPELGSRRSPATSAW